MQRLLEGAIFLNAQKTYVEICPFKREREREIHFFQSGFVFVNAGSRINLMFLDSSYTALHHNALSTASSFFIQICSMCSSICLFHVIFDRPRPLLPATSKSNALLKISPLSILKTCSYHRTPLALACPFKISFKPSKLISSWLLLFSIFKAM